MNNILKFIETFKNDSGDSNTLEYIFTSGYCYHFAIILNNLFGGDIIYNQILDHFACKINNVAYDITGKIELDNNWELWDTYKFYNNKLTVEAKRIIN